MLDLNEQPQVPRYELKVGEVTKSYDPIILGYALRDLKETETDPGVLQHKVNEVLEIDVDAFTAGIILKDFFEFAKRELEEPLKNVFGRELFSTTTSDSAPASSED